MTIAATTTLPALREELSLHPGPTAANGWPSWILRDPARNRFFRIDWPGFEVLSRWHLGDPDAIARAVSAETTLSLDADQVAAVVRMLQTSYLLRVDRPVDTIRMSAAARRPGWLQWLLHHYLFFRIPLVRPDHFLDRTLRFVRWMGRRGFAIATLLALLVGLALLGQSWDRLVTTFLDTISLQGAMAYAGALVMTKVVHELAHAYVAKAKGCRVPTIGVAFLVMWPVLYTDVNESWLLPHRRDRLAVGAAGVLAELTLAAWATLAWGLLADGPMREIAFTLATVTWITSLLVNLSPFMRFDGYFLLMDGLDLPNLHARAFALARWWLREALFDLREPPPETMRPGSRRLMTAFAFLVWAYRLAVFLGIAALVYHFFIKLVGIGLFLVEIGWFVLLPIWNEMREWRKRLPVLRTRWRTALTLALTGLIVLGVLLPLQSGVTAPAIFQASERRRLYPATPARSLEIAAVSGQAVMAGQTLFRLTSPDLEYRIVQAGHKVDALERELAGSGFDVGLLSKRQSLMEDIQRAVAERTAAEREAAQLTVSAPIDGVVTDVVPNLTVGEWLSPKTQLATVLSNGPAEITAYVTEETVDRLEVGTAARFIPAAAGRSSLSARVSAIERTALQHLDAPSLSSVAGGPIAIRPGDRTLTPEKALYRVRLTTNEPPALQELAGTIRIDAARASLAALAWRFVMSSVVRESGL